MHKAPDAAVGKSPYNASHLQRTKLPAMKTATLPSLRVQPELREAAEAVLQEGETLSGFIETSIKESIHRRRVRAEFLARGLASRDEARRTGVYHSAKEVHEGLQQMLDEAKAEWARRTAHQASA